MSTSVTTIVLYVVLVLAVLGGIGAVAYFTSGFTSDFQEMYLCYEGKNIIGSTSEMEFLDDSIYLFEVKYVFGKVAKQKTGYKVKVMPCITDNDFTFTVDGEPHQYSEITDLTDCFDIDCGNESFTIAGNAQMQTVLQRYYEGSVVVIDEPLIELHDYYTLKVYSYNNKASVSVSFHGTDAGGTFRIDPNPIVF